MHKNLFSCFLFLFTTIHFGVVGIFILFASFLFCTRAININAPLLLLLFLQKQQQRTEEDAGGGREDDDDEETIKTNMP